MDGRVGPFPSTTRQHAVYTVTGWVRPVAAEQMRDELTRELWRLPTTRVCWRRSL